MWHFKKNITNAVESEEGYTLLELLVVLVILVLLVGVGAPQVLNQLGKAKSDTARIEAQRLITDLEFFRVDMGRFPTSDEGLSALWSSTGVTGTWGGPYSKASFGTDPWGNSYSYSIAGDTVTVSSLGADGATGGSGEDADISVTNN